MLTIFEPICDRDLDHQTERDRIRALPFRPAIFSHWSLGGNRDWCVYDTAFFENRLVPAPTPELCVAFVAPLDNKKNARGEWEVNKLLADYPTAYRYIYMSPDGIPLQTGWRVGGEVDLGRLKTYRTEGEALIPLESDWVATTAYTYEPNDEGHSYPKVVIIDCQHSPVLLAV